MFIVYICIYNTTVCLVLKLLIKLNVSRENKKYKKQDDQVES